tara:strand:+ start:6646 stop:7065 length:420 start_codon:yes stop_codon:yes gene_type:complete
MQIAFSQLKGTTILAGDLFIHVIGVKKNKGVLRVALFQENQSKKFPDQVKFAYKRQQTTAHKDGVKLTFRDLPPGYYAAAVFHDKNNNGKLDKNFFGMPKEKYGFSGGENNNRRRAAKFDEARFSIAENDIKHIQIRLQ